VGQDRNSRVTGSRSNRGEHLRGSFGIDWIVAGDAPFKRNMSRKPAKFVRSALRCVKKKCSIISDMTELALDIKFAGPRR